MKELIQPQCPKYQQCSAPICPLDKEWQKRKHISGDRVCFYLTEVQKPRANAVFEVQGLGSLYEVMVRQASEISERYHIIKNALDKAKDSSSRMTRNVGAK